MLGGRLNMVRGSQQDRSRNRSALIFLLMVAMLVGAELIDEIYITN